MSEMEQMWGDYTDLLDHLGEAASLAARLGLISEQWQIEAMDTRIEGIRDGLRMQIERHERGEA